MIHCVVRKRCVAALPEEKVRQRLINCMVEEKGFPLSLISVEKSLRDLLSPLSPLRAHVPNRRVDLVAFFKRGAELLPLLLIECKALPLADRGMNQLAGYNHFVRAPFISMANEQEIRTGWLDPISNQYRIIHHLPSYQALIALP